MSEPERDRAAARPSSPTMNKVFRSIFRLHAEYGSTFVGRGQCLRSKLATERSGVCLHPAVLFCSYPLHAAGASPRPTVYNDMQCADITFVLAVCFFGRPMIAHTVRNKIKSVGGPLVSRNVVPTIFRRRTNERKSFKPLSLQ